MTKRYPTNTDLANKLDDMVLRMDKMEEKMEIFNEFRIIQEDRQSAIRQGGKIDWNKFLERALVILTIGASTVYLLVEFAVKRVAE
jgi:hypothetical protein